MYFKVVLRVTNKGNSGNIQESDTVNEMSQLVHLLLWHSWSVGSAEMYSLHTPATCTITQHNSTSANLFSHTGLLLLWVLRSYTNSYSLHLTCKIAVFVVVPWFFFSITALKWTELTWIKVLWSSLCDSVSLETFASKPDVGFFLPPAPTVLVKQINESLFDCKTLNN